jgi:hypothetical protein
MNNWERLGIALSLFMSLGSGAYASALMRAQAARALRSGGVC